MELLQFVDRCRAPSSSRPLADARSSTAGASAANDWNPTMSLKHIVIAASATLLPAAVQAADLAPMPRMVIVAPDQWSFSVTAYTWMSGLDGKQGLFGLPDINVHLKFRDVLPALDFAASGLVEASNGKFGFVGEANFVKLSMKDSGPVGLFAVKLGSTAFFGLAAATYRVADGDWGNVELIGGAKVFSYSNKVTLTAPGPLPVLIGNESQTWVDATFGVKMRYNLSPEWFLTAWGMAGAGGSDYHWDLLGAVGYQFSPTWSVSVGYRAIAVDYKSARFSYDMIQHGPILGVTARF
jgi:hypothetical protein